MRIRPAIESDSAAVAALWTEGYTDRGEGEGRTAPYEEREFFDTAARGQLFVAELAGEVVGVVALLSSGTPGRAIAADGEAELTRLAVGSHSRRQGVGRALAEHCAEQARLLGATAIALWSRSYQGEAHRLYESLGYRRAPERDREDDDGRHLVFLLGLGTGVRLAP
jgi:ribosomal protein S18 acetylase RimI-like enzyme